MNTNQMILAEDGSLIRQSAILKLDWALTQTEGEFLLIDTKDFPNPSMPHATRTLLHGRAIYTLQVRITAQLGSEESDYTTLASYPVCTFVRDCFTPDNFVDWMDADKTEFKMKRGYGESNSLVQHQPMPVRNLKLKDWTPIMRKLMQQLWQSLAKDSDEEPVLYLQSRLRAEIEKLKLTADHFYDNTEATFWSWDDCTFGGKPNVPEGLKDFNPTTRGR